MNERKKPTHQHKETTFSQDPTHVARRRAAALLGTGAVAAGLLAGYNTLTKHEDSTATTSRYDMDKTPLSQVQIENGARIREEPVVDNISDSSSGNILATVEMGDLPEQHKITVDIPDDAATYIHIRNLGSSTPETWVGIPEDAVGAALPGIADDVDKDSDGTVWINSQKASYSEANPK